MFNNDNLDNKLLHETLENLKQALCNYEKNFYNKTYKFSFEDDIHVSMNITPIFLLHLLGFNPNYSHTWLEYISRHQYYSLDWLKDFASSEEFISYYLFARHQQPYLNFEKINFKTMHFKNLDFFNNPIFLFEDDMPARRVINIGSISLENVLSLKLKSEGEHYFMPVSLYVYDNKIADIGSISNISFPIRAKVHKKRKLFNIMDLYSDESKEEVVNKIKKLSK